MLNCYSNVINAPEFMDITAKVISLRWKLRPIASSSYILSYFTVYEVIFELLLHFRWLFAPPTMSMFIHSSQNDQTTTVITCASFLISPHLHYCDMNFLNCPSHLVYRAAIIIYHRLPYKSINRLKKWIWPRWWRWKRHWNRNFVGS